MKLTVSKSKNSESFYITKSFRDPKTKKPTAKVVEKLGTREELENKLGKGIEIVAWGRARAQELTRQEKEAGRKVTCTYDPTKIIELEQDRLFNGGYLFLQAACADAGLEDICTDICQRYSFSYDIGSILSCLVYGRILEPASKRATTIFSSSLIEQSNFKSHQVYRALEVLAKENDFIQAELYKNTAKSIGRKTGVLYYDCTNYFFEIEKEDDFRKYGLSKEHRPSPIVQMGLFMDVNGMPLAFDMFAGNQSEQTSMMPLEEKIAADFNLAKFVTCTDAGLSSLNNRRFNTQGDKQFVVTQSIKKLKAYLRTWALDDEGWSIRGSSKILNLDDIQKIYDNPDTDSAKHNALRNTTFYKIRRIKEKDELSENGWFEQELIVTFSLKHRDYQRGIRNAQIERAASAIAKNASRMDRKGAHDFRRLCKKTSITPEGEIACEDIWELDNQAIAKEAAYDGFYGLCTSLEDDDVEEILALNARRWEIEECFRIMKDEFKSRPVYLSREDRIRAHFLTCFMALLVFRIVEKKLCNKFSCEQIVDTLRSMKFEQVRGEGWRPMYKRTEITDALHAAFGFRTDYEIVTNAEMKRIIKKTRRG